MGDINETALHVQQERNLRAHLAWALDQLAHDDDRRAELIRELRALEGHPMGPSLVREITHTIARYV